MDREHESPTTYLLGTCLELTSGRLRSRPMLLKPAVGVQFDGSDLRSSKARPNRRGQGRAGVIAAQAGDHHPEVSTIGILRHAAPAVIDGTEFRLRRHVPRLRGL